MKLVRGFVGRAGDIAALTETLGQSTRLLTLVGPGGIGKTSLARRWVELRRDRYAATSFGDLTDATDLHGVCSAVGQALGVDLAGAKSGEDAVERLGAAMSRGGDGLVILDNCEQVADAVALAVARWLAMPTRTVFLATSREALRVADERVYEVRPLTLPDDDDVARCEAVQLFIDRARRVRHDYVLSEADAPVVAGIVRSLDGLPLAIELAAARMGIMSPSSIAQNLSRRFELLAGTRRDVTARQQTLRGTLDWSWNLLTAWERAALAQCSLFRGGFTLEAAEAILGLSGIEGAPPVLEVVQSLRDRSLIHGYAPHVAPEDLRLRLYESIREYAGEKRAGDDAAIGRFVAHFVRVGRGWADDVHERGSASATRQLTLEFENLSVAHRLALSLSRGRESSRAASTLMLAMDPVLRIRGPFARHLPLLDETLDHNAQDDETALRARLIILRGGARRMRGMLAEASSDAEAALSLTRETGDLWTRARALNVLGTVCLADGRHEEAAAHFEDALAANRAGGYRLGEASTVGNLAVCCYGRGDLEAALALFAEQIAIGRALDHANMISGPLTNLGVLLQERGRMDEARAAYDEAIAICSRADRRVLCGATGALASLHLEMGSLDQARRSYDAALAVAREIGDRLAESQFLGALGVLYAKLDRIDEAVRALTQAASDARLIGARPIISTIELHRGHVDLALARRDAAVDVAGSEQHVAAAKERLAVADPPFDEVRFARRLLERAVADHSSTETQRAIELVVGPEGQWFTLSSAAKVRLPRKQHRALLVALAKQRVESPDVSLAIEKLIRVVWPGERTVGDSGRHRLHVLVASLRSLGLRDAIRRDGEGYMVAADVRVVMKG